MARPLVHVPTPAYVVLRAFKLNPLRWWSWGELQSAVEAGYPAWIGKNLSPEAAKKAVHLGLSWLLHQRWVSSKQVDRRRWRYYLSLDPAKVGEIELMLADALLQELDVRRRAGRLDVQVVDAGTMVVSLFWRRPRASPSTAKLPRIPHDLRLAVLRYLESDPDAATGLLRGVLREVGRSHPGRPLSVVFAYTKADLARVKKYARFLRESRTNVHGTGLGRNGRGASRSATRTAGQH